MFLLSRFLSRGIHKPHCSLKRSQFEKGLWPADVFQNSTISQVSNCHFAVFPFFRFFPYFVQKIDFDEKPYLNFSAQNQDFFFTLKISADESCMKRKTGNDIKPRINTWFMNFHAFLTKYPWNPSTATALFILYLSVGLNHLRFRKYIMNIIHG